MSTHNAQEESEPMLLKRAEAAKRLGVGLRSVDKLICEGDLPVVRFGASVRIRPADLDLFIRRSVTTAKNPYRGSRK